MVRVQVSSCSVQCASTMVSLQWLPYKSVATVFSVKVLCLCTSK